MPLPLPRVRWLLTAVIFVLIFLPAASRRPGRRPMFSGSFSRGSEPTGAALLSQTASRGQQLVRCWLELVLSLNCSLWTTQVLPL